MGATVVSWVRLDDGYPEHPKVDRVGPLAAWLNVCAWAYCARHLTDGFVPLERVARLARVQHPRQLTGALLAAELWEPADTPCRKCAARRDEARSPAPTEAGVLVHDFLDYNHSRAQVLQARALAAERMNKRRTFARTNGGTNGVGSPAPAQTHSRIPIPGPVTPPKPPPLPSGGRKRRRRSGEALLVELVDIPEGGCPTCAWHDHEGHSSETRCLEHEPNETHTA